jgi:hypothetical protein
MTEQRLGVAKLVPRARPDGDLEEKALGRSRSLGLRRGKRRQRRVALV